MQVVLKILAALASALPSFLAWPDRRRVEKERAEAEARAAAVRADPAAAWLRKFNSQANPGSDSGQAGTDQPGGDQ